MVKGPTLNHLKAIYEYPTKQHNKIKQTLTLVFKTWWTPYIQLDTCYNRANKKLKQRLHHPGLLAFQRSCGHHHGWHCSGDTLRGGRREGPRADYEPHLFGVCWRLVLFFTGGLVIQRYRSRTHVLTHDMVENLQTKRSLTGFHCHSELLVMSRK